MSKWKETELSQIGEVVSGGTPSTSVSEFWNGDILFVTPFDLSRITTAYIENTERKISLKGLANSSANLLPIGSIVVSSRAPIGYVAIAKKELTTNQGCKSIVLNGNFDVKFIYYSILQNIERLKKVGGGTTFAEISKADLEKVKLPHPIDKSEQQCIAKILSTADAVIEKTQAAIAKYKAIKQGMLHDLFTRGIDITTNKLRPRYEDAPELYKESKLGMIPREWEEEKLSSVVEIISGGTPSTHVKEYWNGEIPWLSVDDFNTGNRYATTTAKTITEEGLKNSATNILLPGMIIISARGTVGVVAQMKIPMAFNQSCYGLNSISKYLDNDFLYYFLIYFMQFLGFQSYGSVFDVITKNSFDEVFIPINKNSNEQRLVVERLTSIDNKLQTEQTYLQKMQSLKKGLMEDLLSGKKQVKVQEELATLNQD